MPHSHVEDAAGTRGAATREVRVGREEGGRVLPYGQPEDPPEYGEDGLRFLNEQPTEAAAEAADKMDSSKDTVDDAKSLCKHTAAAAGVATTAGVLDAHARRDLVAETLQRGADERAAILWRRRHPNNCILRFFQFCVPYGGIVASGFSLASSTIGGGIIALPAAFQLSGLAMAVVYLVVMSLLSVYSFVLLAIVAEKTGLRSWQKVTHTLLGKGADYVNALIMWLLCFGGGVSYTVALGSLLGGFVNNAPSVPEYLKSSAGIRCLTSLVWFVGILPLCLPKEINSLRMASFVGMLFVIYFVICMIVHSAQSLHTRGMRNDLVFFQTGNSAIQGLSIFMFGYIAQVNSFEVYREMHKPSVKRMFYSSMLGVMLCLMLYLFAGLFGYLDFGPTVKDSVLSHYDPVHNTLMAVSYIGIMLKMCVAFALHLIPGRDAVYYVLRLDVDKMPWWKNCLFCAAQSTLALVAGLFIPRITTVFGLLGGFCGGCVEFVFPAIFMMYSGGFCVARVGWGHYLGTYFLLIVGIVAIVFGTSAAIYGEVIA